jgi:hypothetical protein
VVPGSPAIYSDGEEGLDVPSAYILTTGGGEIQKYLTTRPDVELTTGGGEIRLTTEGSEIRTPSNYEF